MDGLKRKKVFAISILSKEKDLYDTDVKIFPRLIPLFPPCWGIYPLIFMGCVTSFAQTINALS